MIRSLRDEALLILDGRGAILDVAREVSRVLRDAGIDAAIIGGVAVVLHGHVRTTNDVDVLVSQPIEDVGTALKRAGFDFDASRREFRKGSVPVHLVLADQVRVTLGKSDEVDGIRVANLVDLINMKLTLGLRDPLRAQDLADVIGLIRHHRLGPIFASKLTRGIRTEFKKLAQAIQRER